MLHSLEVQPLYLEPLRTGAFAGICTVMATDRWRTTYSEVE